MGRAFEFRKGRKMKRWAAMAKTFTRIGKDIVMAVKEFCNEHIAQILNYLKLADSEVGLLVNFQNKSLQYKRYAL